MILIDIDNKFGFHINENGIRIGPLLIFKIDSESFYQILREHLRNKNKEN